MSQANGKWKLHGFDTFEGEGYPLPGEYDTQDEAEIAAKERLARLETIQPSSTSGGQSGIQDQVYIERPDGSIYRYFGR